MTDTGNPNRREMIQVIAAVAGAVALGTFSSPVHAAQPVKAPADPLVGIQIAAHSLLDEGIDYCLDLLREHAAVNAPMVSLYAYYGAMGRPLHLLADHGVLKKDNSKRKLPAVYVTHRDQRFANTTLRHVTAEKDTEHAGRDVLAELAEPLTKRRMKLYIRIYEPNGAALRKHIKNGETVIETAADGTVLDKPCLNHPEFRAWSVGTVADLFERYPIDGLQYGAERSGPLGRLLHWGTLNACFCQHCRKAAKDRGIDVERAKLGFAKLAEFLGGLKKAAVPPADGALVGFLRLLMEYPEILAWEQQWHRANAELHKLMRQAAKKLRPAADIGRHIAHVEWGMDLFYRAALSAAGMAAHTDFVKFIAYHEIFGPRLRRWCLEPLGQTLFKGMPMEQVLELFYHLSGHDPTKNPPLNQLEDGLGAPYVFQETRRGVQAAQGKVRMYTGIGTDIPKGSGWGDQPWASDPEVLYQCVRRSFDAGADGIVICREYEENRLESLKVCGKAVRDAMAGR